MKGIRIIKNSKYNIREKISRIPDDMKYSQGNWKHLWDKLKDIK